MTATTQIRMNGNAYVKYGVYEQGSTVQQWLATFNELGGEDCKVTPGWRIGGDFPTDDVLVTVKGTVDAIAYVQQCITANDPDHSVGNCPMRPALCDNCQHLDYLSDDES